MGHEVGVCCLCAMCDTYFLVIVTQVLPICASIPHLRRACCVVSDCRNLSFSSFVQIDHMLVGAGEDLVRLVLTPTPHRQVDYKRYKGKEGTRALESHYEKLQIKYVSLSFASCWCLRNHSMPALLHTLRDKN